MRGKDILVIPDAHAHPEYDNKRFTTLGEYVARWWPDIVVCLGDWADMPSLCKHSSKMALEKARYWADVDAAIDAQKRFFAPIRARKKKLPQFYMTLGNHEDRIHRVVAEDPKLEGWVSMEDLKFEKFGWTVIPYRQKITLQGFTFTHVFPTGVSGRGIGGDNAARLLVKKKHDSCVQGHSHLMGHYTEPSITGRRIHGISAGCYSHLDQVEAWNRDTEEMWWHGVVWLRNAKDGDASIAFVRGEDL